MEVRYAYQCLNDLPAGYALPEGRTKPWGTGHAILSAASVIDAPFAVINADDYYGPEAFREIYAYLSTHQDDDKYRFAMVGYLLKNTVTENGSVARGVCAQNEDGTLHSVTERTKIEPYAGGIHFSQDDGASWTDLNPDSVVSMNLWGFSEAFVGEAQARFGQFLDSALAENPLKAEYFLPGIVSRLIEEDKAVVQVLHSGDKWYGVTYRQDKPVVVQAIADKTAAGLYPDRLWEDVRNGTAP